MRHYRPAQALRVPDRATRLAIQNLDRFSRDISRFVAPLQDRGLEGRGQSFVSADEKELLRAGADVRQQEYILADTGTYTLDIALDRFSAFPGSEFEITVVKPASSSVSFVVRDGVDGADDSLMSGVVSNANAETWHIVASFDGEAWRLMTATISD